MEKIDYKDAYQDSILELYKNPSNFGKLKNPTHESTEYNSICGDEITVQILVKKEKINSVKFSGSGCVLSMVSSSLLTEKIKGMGINDIKSLDKDYMKRLLKIKINPSRIKCVLLPLETVKKALNKKPK